MHREFVGMADDFLKQLILAHLDGRLSDEEFTELQQRLETGNNDWDGNSTGTNLMRWLSTADGREL